MSRSELLEILILQVEENEKLKTELEACKSELEKRNIAFSETGTLAEAAVRINEVFEAADAAAKQYLENISVVSNAAGGRASEAAFEGGDSPLILEAKIQAEEIIAEAKAESEKLIRDAETVWRETLKKAKILLKK